MNTNHKRQGHRSRRGGFTLIEMVLVLAIIALLVGAGVVKLTGVMSTGRNGAAKTDIAALVSALRMYSIQAGRLPTTEQGVKALVELPNTAPVPKRWSPQLETIEDLVDPWGHTYVYRYPGNNGREFDVYSLGQDGVESDDDIGNWK